MIFLYMADFVCQVADALVAFWLFFGHLKLSTALLYSAGTASIIGTSIKRFLKSFIEISFIAPSENFL